MNNLKNIFSSILILNIICCLCEIQIELGVPYFYLLSLTTSAERSHSIFRKPENTTEQLLKAENSKSPVAFQSLQTQRLLPLNHHGCPRNIHPDTQLGRDNWEQMSESQCDPNRII